MSSFLCLVALASAGPAALAQEAPRGELFPRPFVVEHHLVQVDERGGRFAAPPVVDTYGGSWIVSERADGSRLVIDLARREVTEIRPEQGTYSTLAFERLAQVMARVTELEGTLPERTADGAEETAKRRATRDDWTVRELPAKANRLLEVQGSHPAAADLLAGPGVRYLEIEPRREDPGSSAKSAVPETPAAKVWTSPTVRLDPAARAAVADFERVALGTEGLMAAVREHVDGAVPLRTVRPAKTAGGTVEDVVTRLEYLETFDRKKIAVPEGLRRVPHTLEGLMSFLEREAERREDMSRGGSDLDTFTDLQAGGEND